MASMKVVARTLAALLLGLLVVLPAFGDAAGAKKELDTLKKNIADGNTAGIDAQVKLVEFELKDAADSEKKPIQDELNKIKKQLLDAKIAQFKPGYQKSLESYLDSAKRDLAEGRPDLTARTFDSFDSYIDKDEVKEIFTDAERDALKAQMNKYRNTASDMMADKNIDRLATELDNLEKEYPNKAKEVKEANENQAPSLMRSIENDLGGFTKRLSQLPQDKDKVKAMKGRIDKLNADFETLAKGTQSKQQFESIKRGWEMYENEYKGWEAETTNVPLDRFKESNTDVWAFLMPKSKALISRADSFLDNLGQNEDYKAVASMPEVKSYVDGIKKSRDDAYAKMLKNITSVVDSAEKLTYSNENIGLLNGMEDNIRGALGQKSPDAAGLMARVKKLQDNYQQSIKNADAAFEDMYKKMVEEAGKSWPAMKEKYSVTTGFDPDNFKDFKGKTISVITDNLMGYRFKADGSFPFATTLNGKPVACKYTPELAAAIADVEKKVRHTLGDIDSDGKWEIVGVVDGSTGKMMTRETSTGEVRGNSGDRLGTVTREESRPVEAPIVTIVAARCGPLAFAGTGGGSSGSSAAMGGSGGGGWFMRILFLLVGLVAAAAALLKAGYAPIASLPQAGEVQAKLGGDNLAYIGLACAAWGLLWLLIGMIIYGLLVNLAIIAAGLYAALDFLTAKGIVKPDLAAKIKPQGVPIGLACAAIVVLHLFIGGSLWIL